MADKNSNPTIISRKEALLQGLRHYFTGKPCKRGHIARRLLSCNQCCECAKERLREYRPLHRERYRELDRLQKAKDAEKIRRQSRERYSKDPARMIAHQKQYYQNNKEAVKAKRRERYAEQRRLNGAEYHEMLKIGRDRVKRWVADNPGKAKALLKVQKHRRRARERNATGEFIRSDISTLLERQRGKCVYCRAKFGLKYHVDHKKPLSRGGTNDPTNLQLLCGPCNLSKGTRDAIEYAQLLGKLL